MRKPRKAVEEAMEVGDVEAVLKGLTDKQRAFCQEYIVDFNASAACLRAKYESSAPNKLGSELLNKPQIRVVIDHLLQERAKTVQVDTNYVLRKIVRTLEKADDKDNYTAVLRAAELLAKHLGMFVEKTEITGKDGGPIQHEETLNAAADFARSIAGLASRRGEDPSLIEVVPRDTGSS